MLCITCAYAFLSYLGIFCVDGSSQLSLGGLRHRGVPIMSQIRAQSRPCGLHNGNAGLVADSPDGSEVREDVTKRTTRRSKYCRETIAQNTDRARFFGDSFVDLNVKASHRCCRAERADPPTPRGSGLKGACPSEETARKGGQGRQRSADQNNVRPASELR